MNCTSDNIKKQNAGVQPAFWVNFVLFLNLCVILCAMGLVAVYTVYPEGDVFEHIRAAFMVHNGAVPYRDFFEHHHPLLWFLTAPVVGLLEKNSEVLAIMDYLTYIFFVIGLGFIYKIVAEFLSNSTAALMSVILLLMPNLFVYYVYFKPDNFMFTCIAGGIYYLFCYMRDKKRRQLVWSYFWFCTGFLFMQKILVYFSVVGVVSLYLLYKKEMTVKDFLSALVLPLLMILLALGYFLYHGALYDYWRQNFFFNSEMVSLFGKRAVGPAWDVANVVFWAAGILAVVLYKFMNRYFRIWSCFFVVSLAFKRFYFAPHIYYYYEAFYFAVPLVFAGLMKFVEHKKVLLYILLFELQCFILDAGYYQFYDAVKEATNFSKKSDDNIFKYTPDYVFSRIKPCDYILMENGAVVSVFNRPATYYWFIFGHIDVYGARMGFHPLDDFNEAVQKFKPKFIWVDDSYSRFDVDENGKRVVVHSYDMDLINKMYVPTPFASGQKETLEGKSIVQQEYEYPHGLYQLKKEYDTRVCYENKHDGHWGDYEN